MSTHSFDIQHAREYGIAEAILLHDLQYWIRNHRSKGEHAHDGRTWNYNSIKSMQEQFPYLTTKQIRAALDGLLKRGVLVKGRWASEEGSTNWDRRLWYAFADEQQWVPGIAPMEKTQEATEQAICPTGQMEVLNLASSPFAPEGNCICPVGQFDLPQRANESKEQSLTMLEQATTTPLPPTVKEPLKAVVADTSEPGEGFELLAISCGGLGLDDESARKFSSSLPMQDIKARILWAKARGDSPAHYFAATALRGLSVPQEFIEAAKPLPPTRYYEYKPIPEEQRQKPWTEADWERLMTTGTPEEQDCMRRLKRNHEALQRQKAQAKARGESASKPETITVKCPTTSRISDLIPDAFNIIANRAEQFEQQQSQGANG